MIRFGTTHDIRIVLAILFQVVLVTSNGHIDDHIDTISVNESNPVTSTSEEHNAKDQNTLYNIRSGSGIQSYRPTDYKDEQIDHSTNGNTEIFTAEYSQKEFSVRKVRLSKTTARKTDFIWNSYQAKNEAYVFGKSTQNDFKKTVIDFGIKKKTLIKDEDINYEFKKDRHIHYKSKDKIVNYIVSEAPDDVRQELLKESGKRMTSAKDSAINGSVILFSILFVEGGVILTVFIILAIVICYNARYRAAFLEDSDTIGYTDEDNISLDLFEYSESKTLDLSSSDRSKSFVKH